MIECHFEQHWPVTAVLSDTSVTKHGDHSLVLKTEQWNLLVDLIPVVHAFQVATTYLHVHVSAKYGVSTSALFPIVYGLTRSTVHNNRTLTKQNSQYTNLDEED